VFSVRRQPAVWPWSASGTGEVFVVRREPVDSSAISSVGYDPRREILELEFRSGAVYDYFEVPRSVYDSLMKASSKGRFVSRRVRDRFPFERRA